MLKLLSCAQGHYWEGSVEGGATGTSTRCPVCGQGAEITPLLDLEPSPEQHPEKLPPSGPPLPTPLRDKEGMPIVAGYEILSDLGKGPTGVRRYRARQVLVNRIVTLKVVLASEDPGQLAWASLRGEATALGRITHPNIVQILEAGERERQLFFNAIEHVEGPTLAEILSGKPLPFRQTLVLVETLARAMHSAHERKILHRNLKPESILLHKDDGECTTEVRVGSVPGISVLLHTTSFTPKITDFGLARRPVEGDTVDAELQGELPCYLAPEQAWGRVKEIGPATDVYALGAILYQLIGGRPPFREATAAETIDAIQTREPPPLSGFRSRVPCDVEAICRKCLAKRPRRRYASALELAEDLRRCADGHPIKARSHGTAERFGKFLRRNFGRLALALFGFAMGATLVALLAASAPSSADQERFRLQTANQTIARLDSELSRTRQRHAAADYHRTIVLAAHELAGGNPTRARELLSECPEEQRHWEWSYLERISRGETIASVIDVQAQVNTIDLSSDGRFLAVGAVKERTSGRRLPKGNFSLWDVATQQRLWQANLMTPVRCVVFHPNGDNLALVSDNEVQVRSATRGGLVLAAIRYLRGRLTSVSYMPDAERLLLGGGDGYVRVVHADWQTHELREQLAYEWTGFRQVLSPGNHSRILALPPEIERIAYVSPDGGKVLLYPDLASVRRFGAGLELRFHIGALLDMAYDEHSALLATAGRDQTISLWDVRSADKPVAVLRGHGGAVTGVAFSSDGKRLASCGEDGTVRLWDTEGGAELLTLRGYDGVSQVRFQSTDPRAADPTRLGLYRLAVAHGTKVTLLTPR